jgi:hypothetical protein
VRQEEAEKERSAFDWSLARERAGLYAGAMLLVLLFGRQGWLLWHQGRMVFAWALSSTRPIWRDVHRLGEAARGGG